MSKRAERRREIEQQERRQQFVRVAEQEQESYIWDNDPVKQYVRHYGWLDIISGYVARRQSAGIVDPIKYLTLPGAHAIDIGYLCRAGIIQPARGTPRFPQVVICDRKSAAQVNANLGGVLAASNKSLSSAISGTTSELARL